MSADEDNRDEIQSSGRVDPGVDRAPTIYVDGLVGFVYDDFVVRTNAYEVVITSTADDNVVVLGQRTTAHLIISHAVLDQIHDWLSRNIALRNEAAAKAAAERAKTKPTND